MSPGEQRSFLDQNLLFFDDRIEVEGSGFQVMMSWELPLMRRMAEIVAMRRGDVLEVGFGMGLSCDAVQSLGPRSHTIIEAHPQIIERARHWAADKPNVTILAGRWQDLRAQLATYDGISFDVFGGEGQRLDFFAGLGDLLRPNGVATLWLGDERGMPADLDAVLTAQGLGYRLTRVAAIPDKRCRYSRSNEFHLPIITRTAGASVIR